MPGKRKAPHGCYWREGVLWARCKVGGRDQRWSLHTSDPAVATKRREAARERQLADVHHGDARRTMAEVVAAWAPHIERSLEASTAKRYLCSMGRKPDSGLQPFLAAKYLDEIDGRVIADIVRERAADGASNATIKRDLVALSSVMNFAIDEGWTESNPVLPRMRRLKERRDPIMLPDHRDIDLVINRCPPGLAALAEAARRTGARQNELVTATCNNVDHVKRTLTVVGKRRKRRTIDLGPFNAYDQFRALRASVGPQPTFSHDGGKTYKNVSSRFAAIVKTTAAWAKEQGLQFEPFTFHHLRHRHAVDWLLDGRSIYDLQERLGHSSIKITELYLDFLTPELKRVVKYGGGTKRGTGHSEEQQLSQ